VVPRPELAQQHGYVHAGIVATLVAIMQQTLMVMHGKSET
jgi:acyl-coenzyme A thioesterase PaaI-like protein